MTLSNEKINISFDCPRKDPKANFSSGYFEKFVEQPDFVRKHSTRYPFLRAVDLTMK